MLIMYDQSKQQNQATARKKGQNALHATSKQPSTTSNMAVGDGRAPCEVIL